MDNGTDKRCLRCNATKPLDNFYPDPKRRDGRYPYCRECHLAASRASYAVHRDDRLAYKREYGRRVKAVLDPPAAKLCPGCDFVRPAETFAICRTRWDGLQGECRDCTRIRRTARRAAMSEDELVQYRKHIRETYRESLYEAHARRRALARKAPPIRRLAIIARDNHTCYLWCGRVLRDDEITLDHVVPLARGGSHTAENLRVACGPCNSRKSSRLLEELGLSV